ncbi:MAG: TolC family protein [Bacteroidales bacterium]|jgi:outer membrane protein|nr:TolC family protein [Bacteroidales bacterium]
MKKRNIIIAFTALLGTSILAQDVDPGLVLNLSEAIEYADEHNKSLKNSRQEIDKSEAAIWEAISQGLPQADIAVDYMTYFGYELEFSFGGEEMNPTDAQLAQAQSETFAAYPGIPMAGLNPVTPQDLYNYSAGSFYQNTISDMFGGGTILMSDVFTAKLQVSQLIFSGQYIVGIQTAKLIKDIAGMSLSNSEIGTKEAIINAYYLVLISERSLDFIDGNLENLKRILKQTKKMYEIGMAEQTDADQFSITVNQLENTKRSMQRGLELNYNMLRFTLGVPADTKISLTDNLDMLFSEMEAVNLLMTDFNKEENMTYQLVAAQSEINKKLWDIEKWNYAPTFVGFYNYNQKILTAGFDMTPKHLAGLSLSVPVFSSGSRKAKTSQARIQYEMSERNAEILGDQLELQNRQLKYNLESSIENYKTQLENAEVAENILSSYERKFQSGMASSMEVTQANSSFLEAQSTYLSAMFEVMSARIQLEKLMNNLCTYK